MLEEIDGFVLDRVLRDLASRVQALLRLRPALLRRDAGDGQIAEFHAHLEPEQARVLLRVAGEIASGQIQGGVTGLHFLDDVVLQLVVFALVADLELLLEVGGRDALLAVDLHADETADGSLDHEGGLLIHVQIRKPSAGVGVAGPALLGSLYHELVRSVDAERGLVHAQMLHPVRNAKGKIEHVRAGRASGRGFVLGHEFKHPPPLQQEIEHVRRVGVQFGIIRAPQGRRVPRGIVGSDGEVLHDLHFAGVEVDVVHPVQNGTVHLEHAVAGLHAPSRHHIIQGLRDIGNLQVGGRSRLRDGIEIQSGQRPKQGMKNPSHRPTPPPADAKLPLLPQNISRSGC